MNNIKLTVNIWLLVIAIGGGIAAGNVFAEPRSFGGSDFSWGWFAGGALALFIVNVPVALAFAFAGEWFEAKKAESTAAERRLMKAIEGAN